MKCFVCNDPEIDMVAIAEEDFFVLFVIQDLI